MRAKKSLGQNFLKSEKIISDIVNAAQILPSDTVLEIGPGKGALTEKLLATGAKLIAIETDKELIPILSERFDKEIKSKQLTLIHDDIRNFYQKTESFKKGYKIVANIPYYITGEIIREFLSSENIPSSMTLLLQKEVAQRIAARTKESILSLSVKAYGNPKLVLKVPARFFNPVPKIDSAVLHISNISKKFFEDTSEENFFQVVKAGFAQKRKKLLNNLAKITEKEKLQKIFKDLNIEENSRAEDIQLKEWKELCKKMF